MKVTLDQIYTCAEVLRKVVSVQFQSEKTAYSIAKLSRKVDAEIKEAQTMASGLHDKFGSKDEQGQLVVAQKSKRVVFTPENQALFDVAWKELLQTEVEIPIVPIAIEAMKDMQGQSILTPRDINLFGPFLNTSSFDTVEEA